MIILYEKSTTDFTGNGICVLSPSSCIVHEVAGGQFELEMEADEGEYTYALLRNDRNDVTYDFRIPILDSIIHTEEGDVVLRDLQPPTGLLRMGDTIEEANIYDNTAYSGHTTDENNTIFYYEG